MKRRLKDISQGFIRHALPAGPPAAAPAPAPASLPVTPPAATLTAILTGILGVLAAPALLPAQPAQPEEPARVESASTASPPPSSGGFFPLSQVHRGLRGTAWTVFTGTRPEPMDVEILGILRGARGPGHDMILAQLHGPKAEYTGVVAGMSGSPVYIGDKLLGALSYRIGQFSKDPIAGITPIGQMLEVRDLPAEAPAELLNAAGPNPAGTEGRETGEGKTGDGTGVDGMGFQAMETPLVMSGFRPEAVKLWERQMAGTGLETVAAGGGSGSSLPETEAGSRAARAAIVPGSAVSAQLIRGDLEIAATCTVTYVDPRQLLACGHPILQAGPVSLPMTSTEVVATLASPLNAFKIVNTGDTIGAFTEDRDAAIRGALGTAARMIPVHVTVHAPKGDRRLNFEVLDLPSITPQAVMVALYDALLETNESTADTSYHVTGSIAVDGYPPSPLDLWAAAGAGGLPSQLAAAMLTGTEFMKLYSNGTRQGAVHSINLRVDTIPRNLQVTLESARIVSGDIVRAGARVVVEATLHPWHEPARNVRIPITLPARLSSGNLRLLISDASTLDRTRDQPRLSGRPASLETALAEARGTHPADQVYVSLLAPEAQAALDGRTLTGLPLSMANALEPLRGERDLTLNGESAVVAGQTSAGGVLTGFQILNLHIEDGGGLN